MLNISRIELRNFLSYEKETLEFNYDTPVLIHGSIEGHGRDSNGAGKSALLESILYGLFGCTSKGLKADSVVNTGVGKDCAVHVHGTTPRGTKFQITRYRKHSVHKNQLYFSLDGADVSKSTNNETQTFIEHTLEINFDIISYTSFFTPANLRDSFCSLGDANQKSFFQTLLSFDRIDTLYAETTDKLTQILRYIGSLQATLAGNKATQETLVGSLHTVDLDALQDRKSALIEMQQALNLLLQKQSTFFKQIPTLDDSTIRRYQNERDTYSAKLAEVTERRIKLERAVNQCPECRQTILPEDYTKKLQDCKQVSNELTTLIQGCSKKHGVALADYERLSEEAKAVGAKLAELNVIISKVKEDIEDHTRVLDESANAVKLNATINKRLADLQKEVPDIEKSIEESNKKKDKYEILKKAYSNTGVKAYIIKSVIPDLNKILNQYSTVLLKGQLNVHIEYKENTNKLKIVVVKPFGVGYASCSTGEARRVDILVLFGFLELASRMGKSTNFLVLDEIFDGLDKTGIDTVVNLLNSYTGKNMFIISHNPQLYGSFSNIIKIVNKAGVSSVVER